ncbi:MAG: NHL repeat-containing protein [Aliidongia sp.]
MKNSRGFFLTLLVIACGAPCLGEAQTIVTLGGGFNAPGGVAVDGSGNVFVADTANSSVKEILAAGGLTNVNTLGSGFGPPSSVAIDGHGNVFAIDLPTHRVYEIPASGGGAAAQILSDAFVTPTGIAVDGSGNVFVTDSGDFTVKEILTAGGGATVKTISQTSLPLGIAVDSSGNVFLAEASDVREIVAAGGYTTVNVLGSGFEVAQGIAVDSNDNVFVADLTKTGVVEILASGGFVTVNMLGSGLSGPHAVAVDGSGNLFVADGNGVEEIPAAGGHTTVKNLGSGFNGAGALTVDSSANIFFVNPDLSGVQEALASSGYHTIDKISTPGFSAPTGVAVDSSGNVFVADTLNGVVKEMMAADGFTTVKTIGAGFNTPAGIAVDAAGNVFVADSANDTVTEIFAAGGHVDQKILGSQFSQPLGVAVDGNGNVFVVDSAGASEITTTGAIKLVVSATVPHFFTGIAVDGSGNLFLSNNPGPFNLTIGDEVRERLAADHFQTVAAVGSGFNGPAGVAVDGKGNVFVADSGNNAVKEILAAPPTLFASVLPGARSVELGATATIFATVINSGTQALDNCQITPASSSFDTLPFITMNYQTTDPATNALTGTANTPVTIPGNNGVQSFLISFQSMQNGPAFSALGVPLDFGCANGNVLNAAAILPGVDTVDLTFSSTPIADVIALAATPTKDGIIKLPTGGAGAFAVASTNIGATATLTVSVDTGAATLPVTTTICQTNPSNGQCLSPPSTSLSLNYAGGTTPTFSVFLQSTGAIPLSPATSRIFVRFEDASGGLHGLTSVAVEAS